MSDTKGLIAWLYVNSFRDPPLKACKERFHRKSSQAVIEFPFILQRQGRAIFQYLIPQSMSNDKWGFIAHYIYYNLTLYPTTVGVWTLPRTLYTSLQ